MSIAPPDVMTTRAPGSSVRALASGAGSSAWDMLDRLMQQFYEVISFAEGAEPDWDGMSSLFSRHARVTRVTPEGIDYLDVSGFQDFARELLEVGAFTSFYEHEIARQVGRYGNVAHVASAYETKISPRASDYLQRGVNSLQLILESGEWKILSLCWDDHAPFQGVETQDRGAATRI